MARDSQWHRLEGIWYEVTLGTLDPNGNRAAAYDFVLKRIVDSSQGELLRALYANPRLYATGKRQLDGATPRAHGLRSEAA
jgi:hypothetical protein